MFSQRDDNVLTLLAVTIFADKRVFAREIEAFLQACMTLDIGAERSERINQDTLLLWFEANRAELKSIHSRTDFKDWVTGLIDSLVDYPNKESLLQTMHDISRADGEVHVSETALIVICARRWGLGITA